MTREADRTLSVREGDGEIMGRPGSGLIRCGAEIVELVERFYRGIFFGITAFVGVAALAALVLLPLRASAGGPPLTGVIAAAVLVAATPVALLRIEVVYRTLRRRLVAEFAVVLVAAALVAAVFPLRSQLWWPSCTLLMLLAVIAPIGRVLAYCLMVLAINLLAHLLSGDIERTPAVSIIGLWVGYLFWSMTVAAITDQLAAHLMRLNSPSGGPMAAPARRIVAWTIGSPAARSDGVAPSEPEHDHSAVERLGADAQPEDGLADLAEDLPGQVETVERPASNDSGFASGLLDRLTARQLQVLALLVDGLRYRDVADCLSISEDQVQRHVSRAVGRLGVRNATELVAVAVREGLAPPPQP